MMLPSSFILSASFTSVLLSSFGLLCFCYASWSIFPLCSSSCLVSGGSATISSVTCTISVSEDSPLHELVALEFKTSWRKRYWLSILCVAITIPADRQVTGGHEQCFWSVPSAHGTSLHLRSPINPCHMSIVSYLTRTSTIQHITIHTGPSLISATSIIA